MASTKEQRDLYKLRHPDRIAASNRRYRQSEKGRARDRRYAQGAAGRAYHYESNRTEPSERRIARQRVGLAIQDGTLVRQPCEVCGAMEVHGHHRNGYDRAHWFDVSWLCPLHHKAEHKRLRALTEATDTSATRAVGASE